MQIIAEGVQVECKHPLILQYHLSWEEQVLVTITMGRLPLTSTSTWEQEEATQVAIRCSEAII
jgi:hypothetical protein